MIITGKCHSFMYIKYSIVSKCSYYNLCKALPSLCVDLDTVITMTTY